MTSALPCQDFLPTEAEIAEGWVYAECVQARNALSDISAEKREEREHLTSMVGPRKEGLPGPYRAVRQLQKEEGAVRISEIWKFVAGP